MVIIFLSAIARFALALLFLTSLTHHMYPASLIYMVVLMSVTGVTHVYIQANEKRQKKFSVVLDAIAQTCITFIVIAAFGYAQLVTWWLITPLLILPYLINYMGLRIGIATKAKVIPKPGAIEHILGPGLIICSLLWAVTHTKTAAIHQHPITLILTLLLALLVGALFRTIRLAYTSTQ